MHCLSRPPVVPPSLSAYKCGTAHSTSLNLAMSLLCPAARLHPPTGLDECFFFSSFVVRLPYSSIVWQFWLFCVFKFFVVLFCYVKRQRVSTYASILAGGPSSLILIDLSLLFPSLINSEKHVYGSQPLFLYFSFLNHSHKSFLYIVRAC